MSDLDHITQGARGDHVTKIQTAPILLDKAKIAADGQYGPATAAAVLPYEKKRNIINPSYQSQPYNIVGKMTMASLDSETLLLESLQQVPVQIVPLSNFVVRTASPQVEQFLNRRQSLQLNFCGRRKVGGSVQETTGPQARY